MSSLGYYQEIAKQNNAKLIVVSKTHPVDRIKELYDLGQRIFGENRVQELVEKHEKLPKDIEWHLIGHLQKNKVKYIAPFISLIHSVDSLELLEEINKYAVKNNRVIECLLQIHIAQEDTKFGLSEKDFWELVGSEQLKQMKNVKIIGLMGMASLSEDKKQVELEFSVLRSIFENIKKTAKEMAFDIKELSMGMSSDYEIALSQGSTMIRIGTAIFGGR